jgi:hypothetical protein
MPKQPWAGFGMDKWGGARTRPSSRARQQPPRRGAPDDGPGDGPDDDLDIHDAIDDERGDIVRRVRADGGTADVQAAYTRGRVYHTDKTGHRVETRNEALGANWGQISRDGKRWKVSETDKFTFKEVKPRSRSATPRHRVDPVAAAHGAEAAAEASRRLHPPSALQARERERRAEEDRRNEAIVEAARREAAVARAGEQFVRMDRAQQDAVRFDERGEVLDLRYQPMDEGVDVGEEAEPSYAEQHGLVSPIVPAAGPGASASLMAEGPRRAVAPPMPRARRPRRSEIERLGAPEPVPGVRSRRGRAFYNPLLGRGWGVEHDDYQPMIGGFLGFNQDDSYKGYVQDDFVY